MDLSDSRFSGNQSASDGAPSLDPRLQPTPDYGSLGPGSDIPVPGTNSTSGSTPAATVPPRVAAVLAIAIGIFAAVGAATLAHHPSGTRFVNLPSPEDKAPVSAKDIGQLDHLRPQRQAETLLELAVSNNDDAVDQISSRVDGWQGKLQWNSRMATLTTAALNSNNMRVRSSGVEVELVAYGLNKDSASLAYLFKEADSSNHAQKIWALWALGLMANRGVGSDQAISVLKAHLNDADPDSRRWAVEALALTGASETIETLLRTMHDDPSPLVRERAACSLAESGMFTPEQRMTAVPQLMSYTDDPSLDAQTHGWAFQALGDITHQRFGNNPEAWRNWYNGTARD